MRRWVSIRTHTFNHTFDLAERKRTNRDRCTSLAQRALHQYYYLSTHHFCSIRYSGTLQQYLLLYRCGKKDPSPTDVCGSAPFVKITSTPCFLLHSSGDHVRFPATRQQQQQFKIGRANTQHRSGTPAQYIFEDSGSSSIQLIHKMCQSHANE